MLVFAASDKGGTGRSVTSCNLVYRCALRGNDAAYLDFDFGSPTAGTVFQIERLEHGLSGRGLHSYLQGRVSEPHAVDVWSDSDRPALRRQPIGSGRLTLYPGDRGGGEFTASQLMVSRCVDLFLALEEQYDVTLVDLSAGRSFAVETVLAATAAEQLDQAKVRWLVFHRWTRQHIISAHDLVFGPNGILATGKAQGHDPEVLARTIRFVRTAVVHPDSPSLAGLRSAQVAWLQDCSDALQTTAGKLGLGRTALLGTVPLDPVLQFREQLLSDDDVSLRQIANRETVEAFAALAEKLGDDEAWAGL